MKINENPVEATLEIKERLRVAFGDHLKVTFEEAITREKGYYGVCYVRPSKVIKAALSIDREILVLITTFSDQQTRTIQTAKNLIEDSEGRLDSVTVIIVHCDARGNAKLKKWGREQGLAVLPLYYGKILPSGPELLRTLAYELYSFDPFDVTGPVADDTHFYGRRDEARELAKKLQSGHIRACFGIRKIGKTSIIHRVINEARQNYDCRTFLIDAQRDAVFNLNAGMLLNSIAASVESSDECTDLSITVSNDTVEISDAAERLRAAVSKFTDQIILVFDETDYLTPSSPTAPHWKSEFNKFWRNLRAVYQSCSAQNRNLSMLISGVSSKWFSEESIDAIENAALHFVPEEYLSPLPRGASVAMIRRLGKTAGLNFSDAVADNIAEICADMPFWIRKSCSYIHGKIDVGLRPFEPQKNLVDDYLKEFISSDGTAMSEVALTHLFRVYPELRVPALECEQSRTESISPTILRALQKYGIIGKGAKPAISGLMMRSGLASLREKIDFGQVANLSVTPPKEESAYGEWAEELATISRRRNIIERRLREMVSNFIRFSSMSSGGEGAKERILKCINKQRRSELESFNIDKIMGKLYWLEVMAVVKKEWAIFQKIFGDQAQLNEFASIVNDRPDAHAKDLDQFEIAMHRRAVSWFEEKLDKT